MRLPSAELPKVQNSNYGTSFKKGIKMALLIVTENNLRNYSFISLRCVKLFQTEEL